MALFLKNLNELKCDIVNMSILILACLPHFYSLVPNFSSTLLFLIFFICVFQLVNKKIWMSNSVFLWWLYLCVLFEGSLYSENFLYAFGFVLRFLILIVYLSYMPEKNDTDKIICCYKLFISISIVSIVAELFIPDVIRNIRNFLIVHSSYRHVSFEIIDRRMSFFSSYNGFFADPAVSAFYSAAGVGVGIYYLILNKEKKMRAFLWMLLSVIGVFLTYKRGPLLSVLFAMLVTFFVVSVNSLEVKIKAFIKILFICGIAVYLFNTNEIVSGWYDRINSNIHSTEGRTLMYAELWDNFKNNPLFGSGTKSTKYLLNGIDGHNIYLASLSEHGFFGTIVFISALVVSIIETIKILKVFQKTKQKWSESVTALCLFMQLYICIYGMTGNPFSNVYSLAMYFMCVALPLRLNRMLCGTMLLHEISQKKT